MLILYKIPTFVNILLLTIFIYMKKLLLMSSAMMLFAFTAMAQKTVTGLVSDDSGIPLPGASVVEQGTSNGVSTDFDGNYSIEVAEGAVLEISFIGYQTMESTVGSSDSISVSLQADNELDEIVLTALGLEKKKDDDLSSTTKVEVDQLQRSGESGLLQGLSGKTSGVNITRSSGDPGSGAYIQIRGQNTINGDTAPLIVLDGAIISNSNIGGGTAGVVQQSRLNDINPEDIASVTVIKGASAAAIYGTGAANGVLVIETKRGSSDAKGWSVNVKSALSIDEVNAEWEKQDTWGQGISYNYSQTDSRSYGDEISLRSGGADVYDFSSQYFETPDGRRIGSITAKNNQTTFNQSNRDAVFGNGYTYENSVNFSYTGDKNRTYLSVANFDQDGILKGNSDYKRTTLKLNNTTQATDKLLFKISSSYSSIDSNRVQTGSNLNGLYLGYLRTSPDFDLRDWQGKNVRINSGVETVTPNSHRAYRKPMGSYRTFDNASGAFSYSAPIYNNPLWTLNQQQNINTVNRFIFAPEVNYDINDNLSFVARYSTDFYQDNRTDYLPSGSAGDGSQGQWEEDRITEKNTQINVFVTGKNTITNDISINYVAGYQAVENNYRRLSAFEASFTNPDQVYLNPGNTTGLNSTPSGFTSLTRKNGVYGIINLELYDNLLLEFTGRGETVSTLPGAGVIFYPSASLGYKFTDLVNADFLNFGKFRLSYGEVGIEASPYATSTVYGPGGIGSSWGDGLDGSLYGNPFTQSSQRGNPDLKEERKSELEFGFDVRMFDSRVNLGFTYYDNKTEDVILALPTVPSSGFTSSLQNAATISNKGIEIDFKADLVRSEDLNVSINGSFTQNKNNVDDLAGSSYFILNGFTSTSSGIAEGQPFGVFRGGVYERDASGNFVTNANGFPNAAGEKKIGVGDPNPDFRAGLGLNVNYKNFNLSALFETSQGNDVWNGTYGVLKYFGIHPDTQAKTVNNTGGAIVNAAGVSIANGASFRGNIQDFGAGPVAVDRRWWTTNGGGFGDVSENFIMDGSWVKLREVTLSYNFDSALIESLNLSTLQLSVSGRNLFTWTGIEGFDPENNLTGASKGRGLEYFSNPGTRSFITTLRIGF
jgi:TonB-linked SusC/RagA family outer membrane protein